MKNKVLVFALILAVMPIVALAASGNLENGKTVYQKRCLWCHGEKGAGDGPAADFLNPRPRDLTEGVYKFKTTPFDELSPSDEDFFNLIKGQRTPNHIPGWTGMNDSSMPGWGDMLTDQEIWDLVPYIKSFSGLEKNEKPSISYDKQIKSSDESIAKGKEKFDE
ncbi:MAG: cytochrome c, partial [Deltaproteobacteria bacterium]|nr:cytochrome c [Deltaproteobacteria bacterium]